MCGIAGYVGPLSPIQGEQALLAMAHRGPDGQGVWQSNHGLAWLGHQRLAIIDLKNGQQPLATANNIFCITFNGCIYNYLELKASLSAKGYVFRTQTDTEVILHAYAEYGDGCLKHLNGMFAFALWDEETQTLFCARDRLGQKPFYYLVHQDFFCFASEIKGLLAMDVILPQPDLEALQEYLTFQMLLDDKTLFKGIYKLKPGNFLTYKPCALDGTSKLQIHQYWDLDYTRHEATQEPIYQESVYIETLQHLLEESVRMQTRSDVPVGAYLSGGMDSSVVTCLMAKNRPGESIHTFTGAFSESPHYDESGYAKIVSDFTGSIYHETKPTALEFMDDISKIIYHMDEPTAGPGVFPQYRVAQEAAQHVKVVLGGQGGDEIFSGYARYQLCQLEETLEALVKGTGDSHSHLDTLRGVGPNVAMLEQYLPMMKGFWNEGIFAPQDQRYFKLMNRSGDFRDLVHPEFFEDFNSKGVAPHSFGETAIFDKFKSIFNGSNATTFLEKIQYFDIKTHLQALCHVDDRTNMAWGIESRSPLMDYRILEWVARIPPSVKFKYGTNKYLLKTASYSFLPPAIYERKDKMGFPVPLSHWLRHQLKDPVHDLLLNPHAAIGQWFDLKQLRQKLAKESTPDNEYTRGIWGLLCLELWFQNYL
ncbi:MAG: asparagine synthase (glutamine-hydrolyzing) [Cyanobacteria bacterium]|nr:asparagine synthase (glutamine-hydrolyzing) [Cyanobacteriota bacterium]